MKFLVSRKLLFALGAVAGLLAVWRLRASRRAKLDLEWESEIAGAIDEGRAAGGK